LLLCVSLCCIKAEKKPKVENLCRSVGGLKFDSTQTSKQRVSGLVQDVICDHVPSYFIQSKGLEECGKYRKNTCCNETHIIPLRV
jgi:hypothetical protein